MMKIFSSYLLFTTLTLLGAIATPSQAKNCPDIPKAISELTVKSNQAYLRQEPSSDAVKGVSILEGDKLKVIEHSAKPDQSKSKDTYCWYLVSKIGDPKSGKYYIADSGIKEFPYSSEISPKITQSPSPVSSDYTKATSPQVSEPNPKNNNSEKTSFLQTLQDNWQTFTTIILMIILAGVVFKNKDFIFSNLSNSFKSRNRLKQRTRNSSAILTHQEKLLPSVGYNALKEVPDDLQKSIKSIQNKLVRIEVDLRLSQDPKYANQEPTVKTLLLNIQENVNQCLEKLNTLEKTHHDHKTSLQLMEMRIEQLENINLSKEPFPVQKESGQAELSSSSTSDIIFASGDEQTFSSQLQEIIDRFNRQLNHQRPELFQDFDSTPLTLTQDAIQGKVGINARRIVQLEISNDISQAIYLKFDVDQTAWLIPNIKSPYISKIMGRLSENPEVFIITSVSNSDSLQLKKPAKLKEISVGLWEIEEPGKFTK